MRQRAKFMAALPVLSHPDERLRKIAKPVAQVDDRIKQLIEDMIETMYQEEGIGLAATQVDVHEQIIVIDLSEDKTDPIVVINPQIIEKNGETAIEEGCLSVPETRAFVPRSETIKITALNEKGEKVEIEAEGLLAICLQHEMDHLKGKLFVDYLSPLKQDRIKKKLLKIKKLED